MKNLQKIYERCKEILDESPDESPIELAVRAYIQCKLDEMFLKNIV